MTAFANFTDEMSSNRWDFSQAYNDIEKRLIELGWKCEYKDNVCFGLFSKKDKELEIAFAHPPITDRPLIITDSVVKNQSTLCTSPTIFGHFYREFEYTNSIPTKKFNCFIHRGCSYRQGWFYQLVKNNLLEEGFVSYHCFDTENKTDSAEYFEQLFLSGNQNFEQEHTYIKSNLTIPFINFDDTHLEQVIVDSEKSLTIETFFAEPDVVTFSEKTWRSLQLPRPMLLFGHPYSIKQLRDWGFDVYDDYIDHSYDNELISHIRQSMILKELIKPISYTSAVLEDFENRAEHNRQILKNYSNEFIDFFPNFLYNLKNL